MLKLNLPQICKSLCETLEGFASSWEVNGSLPNSSIHIDHPAILSLDFADRATPSCRKLHENRGTAPLTNQGDPRCCCRQALTSLESWSYLALGESGWPPHTHSGLGWKGLWVTVLSDTPQPSWVHRHPHPRPEMLGPNCVKDASKMP